MLKVWLVARIDRGRTTPIDHKLFFIKESAEKFIEKQTPIYEKAKKAWPNFERFELIEFWEKK